MNRVSTTLSIFSFLVVFNSILFVIVKTFSHYLEAPVILSNICGYFFLVVTICYTCIAYRKLG